MSKFHVKANGDMGRCTAQEGACPFSSEGAEHFDNFQNAALYAEAVIAKDEGGSFAAATHSRSVSYDTFEVNKEDPENYTDSWDVSSYMGQYIDRGDTFLYEGEIYTADDWEWNRAVLHTVIEATRTETGEKKEITIRQGDEGSVSFIDKQAVTLRDGRNVRLDDLHEELEADQQAAEEVVDNFLEAEEDEGNVFRAPSGREFHVSSRPVTWGGNELFAVRTGDVPLEAEDDYRDTLRNMKFFRNSSDAYDEMYRVRELADFS